MISREDKIKESNSELDSLILEIKERATKITESVFPNPAEIVYINEKLKRSEEKIYYPTNDSAILISQIWKQYWFAAFSNNPKQIQFIKDRLGLTEAEDWFFNIDDILHEFDKINATKKFSINYHKSLANIYNYVGNKIFALLSRKYTMERNNEPLSVDRIRNYKDTINNAKRKVKIPIQNNETTVNEKVLELAGEMVKDSINSNKDNFKIYQSFVKGTCEALYLHQIYSDYLTSNSNYKEGEKQLAIFDLFRLIIKDRFLKDEDTYSTTNSTFSNYNAYKKDAVKKILKLK